MSRTDRLALRRQAAHTKERLEKERREKQAQAARRAVALWNDSLPATNLHPYLMRKGITAGIARIYKSALVLPVTDTRKRIISLQFIREDGSKRLLPGGRKKGGFIPVAGDLSMGQVIICEGWATGRTLAGDNPDALVLAAIDAGNLKRVALAICSCSPQAEIIIAGDDDRQTRGNPGVQKAMEAAHAIGGKAIFPSWPPNAPDDLTDFNDLAALWYEAEVAHD
ncbi:toprim domain-containing protein [Thiohalomonas denitrificans]|uniref:toprim domain-containing protein n=1 Tax=Thiohalomonas denitrificans TaxID=415747 RepID=UPI00158669EB|nr:toprim domain-containing protein [Thiohalomonas denitrificans]